jgi:hypothetical protein
MDLKLDLYQDLQHNKYRPNIWDLFKKMDLIIDWIDYNYQ